MMCLKPLLIINPRLDKYEYYENGRLNEQAFKRRYGKEAFINVPCGKCEACIERKANEWSSRLYHEWLHSKSSVFFTLTYNDDSLIYNDVCFALGSYKEYYKLPVLSKKHVQEFMYKLRKKLGNGLRFFCGAEYGEDTGRPHYHFVLFNYPDVEYIYDVVNSVWSYGNIQLSEEMNIQRIMYVAKYIYSSYTARDLPYVENFQFPFILMSRRPGIGYQYTQNSDICEYHNRTLDTSVIIDDGKKLGLPRYYREKIFTPENKEILYQRFINDDKPKPSESEVNVFLNRFKQKKRGKSI